jgi:hypothetical protein
MPTKYLLCIEDRESATFIKADSPLVENLIDRESWTESMLLDPDPETMMYIMAGETEGMYILSRDETQEYQRVHLTPEQADKLWGGGTWLGKEWDAILPEDFYFFLESMDDQNIEDGLASLHFQNPNGGIAIKENSMTLTNKDTGSLFILPAGSAQPAVGTRIQIEGEDKVRTATWIAGSAKKGWTAYFKGQGILPVGEVTFTILED